MHYSVSEFELQSKTNWCLKEGSTENIQAYKALSFSSKVHLPLVEAGLAEFGGYTAYGGMCVWKPGFPGTRFLIYSNHVLVPLKDEHCRKGLSCLSPLM